jgi:hypothetical protein
MLINYAINFKWILSCFEQIFGMRINFRKCDLGPINIGDGDAQIFAQTLSCKLGKFPLQYLGVPFAS